MIDIDLEKYILNVSTPEDELLNELYRRTHTSVLNPNMISGHIQGKLLELLVRMLSPKLILEIGTYTSYSAISMARGLPEGGQVHTIEKNDELDEICREFIQRAGMTDKIILHSGDAIRIIRDIDLMFDLVFIDGDKREYPQYYELSMEKLKPGGFILADNVLWGGKVIQEDNDPMTEGIKKFNKIVMQDNRTENIIIPVRDGIMLIRKLG